MGNAEKRKGRRGGESVTDGFTRRQLRDAEDELEAGSTIIATPHATTMATLVSAWYFVDHQREAARMTYARVVELRKLGRNSDTDGIVKQYATAKEELELIEGQLRAFLEAVAQEDEVEAETLLESRHPVPGTPVAYRLPLEARERVMPTQPDEAPNSDG